MDAKPELDKLEAAAKGLPGGPQLVSVARKHPECAGELLEAADIWRKRLGKGGEADAAAAAEALEEALAALGESWCCLAGQSFQVPRGNFDVDLFGPGTLRLKGKSATVVVPHDNIAHVVELPLPNKSGSRLLFALKEPVRAGKLTVRNLLVTPKPSPKSKELTVSMHGQQVTDTPCDVWKTVVNATKTSVRVEQPSLQVFKSSAGLSGLKCYHGVDDGFFFPLTSGLAFIQKPTLFLALEKIQRVELQRQCEGGARNFDVNIVMRDGAKHEIRMLEKDEFQPFAAYVEKMKINDNAAAATGNDDAGPAGSTKPEVKAEGAALAAAAPAAEDNDDSEHDSEFTDEEQDDSEASSVSSSDRESDVDEDDIAMDLDIEREDKSSVVEAVLRRRRGAARMLDMATSSSSAAIGTITIDETAVGEDAQPLLPMDAADDGDDGGGGGGDDDDDDDDDEAAGADGASGSDSSTESESGRKRRRGE